MFRLGLTGSMATGKSTVLDMFRQKGIPVYSADAAVHELYEGDAVAPVNAAFPGVAVEGRIDRQKLGAALISAPERMAELEAIVHPLVHRKMHDFLADAEKTGAPFAVLEVPLLFETGRAYPVDAVAVTACDDAVQKERALLRPGMTLEKFDTIIARQMPQAEKKTRADFIIDTGNGLEKTRAQVDAIIERYAGGTA